jgi:NADH dehydrogenase
VSVSESKIRRLSLQGAAARFIPVEPVAVAGISAPAASTVIAAASPRKRVLVTGASGFIGRHVVRALAEHGDAVVAFGRSQTRLESPSPNVEIVTGDITDARAVIAATAGCTHVVHLAAMTSSAGTDYHAAARVNLVGTKNVLDACAQEGVERLVVVGTQSENPGAYARTKREADDLVRVSNVPHVLLNPSLVYGPGAAGLFGSIARAAKKLPVVPVIGSGEYPVRPVFIDDVAAAIVRALGVERPLEQYFLSGPESLPFRDFLAAIGRAQGKAKPGVRVPYPLVALGIRSAEAVRLKLPVTSDTLRGLVNPRIHDSLPAERDLDFRPTPLAEGLRRSFRVG